MTSNTTPDAVIAGPALWPAQAHVPSVMGRQLVIERGEGSFVTTTDGRRLYDGTAGLWHANVGHGRPELAQAAYDQMMRLETYHTFARFSNDRAMELAERLAGISPIPEPKIILNSGGSDAIDVACKLARRHWQREGREGKKTIISREFAYHGLHAFGTSIGGLDFNREGYGSPSLVPETVRVPLHDAEAVARTVAEGGADNIAAIITEPIQGTGGGNPPRGGYPEAGARTCPGRFDLFLSAPGRAGWATCRPGTRFATKCDRSVCRRSRRDFGHGVADNHMKRRYFYSSLERV